MQQRGRPEWALRWNELLESFSSAGPDAFRKWLGWALYRIAARVNPEILD